MAKQILFLTLRLIISCALFLGVFAHAMPSSIDTRLTKLGDGEMRWLFMDLYEAEYFIESKNQNLTPPAALKLRYLRNISSAALVEATVKEWQRMNVEHGHIKKWVNELTAMWPSVAKHDEIDRARVIAIRDGEMDGMIVQLETSATDSARYEASVMDCLKLRGRIELVAPGGLPRDGLVIEDQRKYD